MKKVLLVVGLALATMGVNAQLFVGGSINFGTNTNKNADGDKTSQVTNFGFSPEVGYSISDKLDLGIDLNIGVNKTTTWQTSNTSTDVKSTTWGIAPFAQYSVVEFGKFSVKGRATLYLNGNKGVLVPGDDKSTSIAYGLNVAPYLFYDLNDSFSLFGGLNFLSLNLGGTTAKYDGDKAGSSFAANLGVNANNLATTGAIQVGFVYKF